MSKSADPQKQGSRPRTKVKTGCVTCRARKIKCDQGKPFCRKCVDTGRTCDGYESPFRNYTGSSMNRAPASLQLIRPHPHVDEFFPHDIHQLGRALSTKTMLDVKMGYDEEARQLLQASLTNLPVRLAILSLSALRVHLEATGAVALSVARKTPGHAYHYGLEHYCMALGSLSSSLSSSGTPRLRLALLCCQVFISIEQVQGNYAAMVQHIIRGLQIMHEYRKVPKFGDRNPSAARYRGDLPFLDIFIIKLFSAPCKFADPPAVTDTADEMQTEAAELPVSSRTSSHQQAGSARPRTIVPDMRTELTRVAASTMEFLEEASHAGSTDAVRELLCKKTALLESLESWLENLDRIQLIMGPPHSELLSVSFLRIFHQILRVILLGALDSSPGIYDQLQTENQRLQDIASSIERRVNVSYKSSMRM